MFRVIAFAVTLCWFTLSSALAQTVITVCNAATGHSFFLNPNHGWQRDGVSGTVTFIRQAQGEFDLIIKDAATTFSARGDGATIVRAHGTTDHRMTLVVIYPRVTVETYQLALDINGRGKLIWTTTKDGVATRGSLFVADCAR
jgi:hypothetical protein